MENVQAFLIIVAVVTFIMFLTGVPDAIYLTISAVFFLIFLGLKDSNDSDY